MSQVPSPPKSIPASPRTTTPPASAPAAAASTPATPQKAAPRPSRFGFLSLLLIGGLVLAALVWTFGIAPRQKASAALDQEQKLSTQRTVVYAPARLAAPKTELDLPGTMEAFQQASIYARTNGYVKKWNVDIGDQVHEGDLMAELDTPEVDQQLSEAKANVEQAKASLAIAQATADRWNAMVAQHAVSQEEADEKNAARDEAKATLDADAAIVSRLTDQQDFKEIRAPFTGTITHRDIEVGNLVASGNGTGTHELYRVTQTDPLRLYLDVPEASAPAIHPGVEADIHVAAYPDRIIHGEVVRSSGALDTSSRTLQTEVRVPNKDGALLPGTYADVRLQLVDSKPTVMIPANTLIVNAAGTQVALLVSASEQVKDHFQVHIVPVKVGRDFGTEVEVLDHVKEGDFLVTNPPADLTDGMIVSATAKPAPKPPAPLVGTPAITTRGS